MALPEVTDGTEPLEVRLASDLRPSLTMEVRIEGLDDKGCATVTEVRLVVDDPDAWTIGSAMAVLCSVAEAEVPDLVKLAR